MLISHFRAGFTLIELMVVVAIISILASISIPQYQDYSTRARLVEAMQILSGARLGVTEFFITRGALPEAKHWPLPPLESTVVETLVYDKKSAGEARLSVRVKGTGSAADGQWFSWVGEVAGGTIRWHCQNGGAQGDQDKQVPAHLLPSNCHTPLAKVSQSSPQ
jgi:type IV pilus assembly protein PilA